MHALDAQEIACKVSHKAGVGAGVLLLQLLEVSLCQAEYSGCLAQHSCSEGMPLSSEEERREANGGRGHQFCCHFGNSLTTLSDHCLDSDFALGEDPEAVYRVSKAIQDFALMQHSGFAARCNNVAPYLGENLVASAIGSTRALWYLSRGVAAACAQQIIFKRLQSLLQCAKELGRRSRLQVQQLAFVPLIFCNAFCHQCRLHLSRGTSDSETTDASRLSGAH
mmetsp:Transcript_23417/g.54502  ORF Transcript_23417/g.54502 Transcript_23417/m.54502 type:complete len:223 (-) Transcript_23417:2165-2833(-)